MFSSLLFTIIIFHDIISFAAFHLLSFNRIYIVIILICEVRQLEICNL